MTNKNSFASPSYSSAFTLGRENELIRCQHANYAVGIFGEESFVKTFVFLFEINFGSAWTLTRCDATIYLSPFSPRKLMNISYAQHQIIVVNPCNTSQERSFFSVVLFFSFCVCTTATRRITHNGKMYKMKNGLELNMNTGANESERVSHRGKRKVSLIKMQKAI